MKHVGYHHGKSKSKQKSNHVHVHNKRETKKIIVCVYHRDFELTYFPFAPFREMIYNFLSNALSGQFITYYTLLAYTFAYEYWFSAVKTRVSQHRTTWPSPW